MNSVSPDNRGTANLAVLSDSGDAVVATNTINTEWVNSLISMLKLWQENRVIL